ncbi:MAG: rod shape-determining protein MreC [bacterium]
MNLKKIITIAGLIVLLFFLANKIFFFQKGVLENIATTISYPFLQISNFIVEQAQKIAHKKMRYKELCEKCSNLQRDYDTLFQEVITLRAALRHKRLSYELVSFQKRYGLENAHLCKILIKHFADNEHYFLINQGSTDGIEKNMVAIYKLQILGKVTEVYPYHSKITLITDRSCKIAAFTNTTNAQGIVAGTNDINQFKLLYVNRLSSIIDNDLVFSSGQGLVFPEGFCLGEVTEHSSDKQELYHQVTVKPIADMKTIKYCLLTNQSKINLF